MHEKAFGPDVKVGVLAVRYTDTGEDWWRTAHGTREILDQAIAFAWTKLFWRADAHSPG